MKNFGSMLGSLVSGQIQWSWGGIIDSLKNTSTGTSGITLDWLEPLLLTLSTAMWIALALVGAAGGLYALYVGIKMAKADSAEAREENKKRMINIVITIIVVIVLILFFNIFLPALLDAFNVFNGMTYTAPANP